MDHGDDHSDFNAIKIRLDDVVTLNSLVAFMFLPCNEKYAINMAGLFFAAVPPPDTEPRQICLYCVSLPLSLIFLLRRNAD